MRNKGLDLFRIRGYFSIMTLGSWVKWTLTSKIVLSDTSDAAIFLWAHSLRVRSRNGKHFFQMCVLNCILEMPASFWWLWRQPGGIVLDGDLCMWPDASYTGSVAHKLRGMEMGFAHSPSRFAAPDDSICRGALQWAFWHRDCRVYCRHLLRSELSRFVQNTDHTRGDVWPDPHLWSSQLSSTFRTPCWNDSYVAQVRMKTKKWRKCFWCSWSCKGYFWGLQSSVWLSHSKTWWCFSQRAIQPHGPWSYMARNFTTCLPFPHLRFWACSVLKLKTVLTRLSILTKYPGMESHGNDNCRISWYTD